MFILKITEENMDKIMEILPDHYVGVIRRLYIDRTIPWYFIRGYISASGRTHLYNILPVYVADQVLHYDTEKANTDWDICTRKEVPE